MRQIQDAYILAATRTAVGKAPRGAYRTTRPDTLLAHVLQHVLAQAPGIEPARVDDVIVGCAMPEYEQGMNVARIGVLLAGLPPSVPGMTINRFCSSGLNAVSIAADRIRTGEADIVIAAGTESMSMIPMLGRLAMNADVFARDENVGIAYGMGLTSERVAAQWSVTREAQDAFALFPKLGFTAALIPKANAPKQPIEGLNVMAVERIEQAIDRVRDLE